MARMHSRKKGKSGSTKPAKKDKKSWIRYSAKEIEQLVIKVAKQGHNPSMVGMVLRDSYGIPDVKALTKKKIMKILEENKIKYKLPEDLLNLIKKDIKLMKHFELNKKDMPVKRGLRLTESKIKRLVKYYKGVNKLPEDWKYERAKAKLLIE